LATVSAAYDDPPLFSEGEAPVALDRAVVDSLGRRGLWEVVSALEEVSLIEGHKVYISCSIGDWTGVRYGEEKTTRGSTSYNK
jgi:hypothetical protein